MTATDELRKMLDERGVEWRKAPHYSSDSVDNETVFCSECIEWLAHDHLNGKLGLKTLRYEITPAQAIAATLSDSDATTTRQPDAGTCHNESVYPSKFFCCSECGISHIRNAAYVDMPNFCPNCGRKVVDE